MSCPDCFRGGKAVGEPKGTIETLYGLPTYVAGPAPTTSTGSTIIFYTDAFGLGLVNNKLLADDYAAATGFRVLVPDIIPGGPMSLDVMPLMDKVMAPVGLFDIWGQITRATSLFRALSYAAPFMWRAFPSAKACYTPSLAYARAVKKDLPPGAKVGVAGFCWGGFQSLYVSKQPAVEDGSERLVDAQFCAHPSGLKVPGDLVDAVLKYKTAVTLAQAVNDYALPTKKVEEAEALLRQKTGNGDGENGFNWKIKYYDGVGHGFAVRAAPGSQKEADGADEAKEQAIEWFKKWL